MQEKIKKVEEEIIEKLNNVLDSVELDNIRVAYLGKKGVITEMLKSIVNVEKEKRKEVGMHVNVLRTKIEDIIQTKKKEFENKKIEEKIKNEKIDVSMNDIGKRSYGHKHPLTIVLDDIKDIFIGMGYSIAEGPEIETTFYNFDALNAPADHPSRDLQDTMYITDDIILRTQTSPVQARVMTNSKPPIKIIAPGRVYRSDSVDATHSPMFHQVEGLVVDKDISMANLKGTLEMFSKMMFGDNTKVRFRPHHFPFTEPSCEVDVSCFVCGGKGCRVCKGEGWIEILGAGEVHPNVLRACNITPNEYQGFAFGVGVERIAMIKFGINDMRYIYENDVRFLNKF